MTFLIDELAAGLVFVGQVSYWLGLGEYLAISLRMSGDRLAAMDKAGDILGDHIEWDDDKRLG